MTKLNVSKTGHGQTKLSFLDQAGKSCCLVESREYGNKYIRLGVAGASNIRLSPSQVSILLPYLQEFAKTGYLPDSRVTMSGDPVRKPGTKYRSNPDAIINKREEILEEFEELVRGGMATKTARMTLAKKYYRGYGTICQYIRFAKYCIDPKERAQEFREKKREENGRRRH